MIDRIDHVAIAVKDYAKALDFFTRIFGAIPGSNARDDAKRYFWQNFSLGDLSRIEILTPTDAGSFLDKFLHNREGGVHHITLQTPDIAKAMEILEAHGIPYFGYKKYPDGVWKELFIHPKDAFGVLIQIAEFRADDWLAECVRMPEGSRFRVEKTPQGYQLLIAHPGGGKAIIDLGKEELRELINSLSVAL